MRLRKKGVWKCIKREKGGLNVTFVGEREKKEQVNNLEGD